MRPFKKHVVKELVNKNWYTKTKVIIEEICPNSFKFTFMLQEDKKQIFDNRLWTLSGAHFGSQRMG